MADFAVPTGWKFYGNNNGGSQTIFTLPGHTVTKPRLAIFDRQVPRNNGKTVSNPMYRIRVTEGVVDADGNPVLSKVSVDCTIRWPQLADSADVIADIALLASTLADVDLQDDIVNELLLPYS